MNRTLLIIAMFCSASTFAQSPVINNAEIDGSGMQHPVSYTHLTLPTSDLV